MALSLHESADATGCSRAPFFANDGTIPDGEFPAGDHSPAASLAQ